MFHVEMSRCSVPPVVLLDVIHQLRLDVGFPWDGDGVLHERLVEIHLVHLQLQLLGDLKSRESRGETGKY